MRKGEKYNEKIRIRGGKWEERSSRGESKHVRKRVGGSV